MIILYADYFKEKVYLIFECPASKMAFSNDFHEASSEVFCFDDSTERFTVSAKHNTWEL